MTTPSEYVFESIREGPQFTLYRGRQRGNPSRVLVIAQTSEQPSPLSLRRLEHEYSGSQTRSRVGGQTNACGVSTARFD